MEAKLGRLRPELADFLRAEYRRGHFNWGWLDDQSVVAFFEEKLQAREATREEKAARMERRGGQLAGLVPLRRVLDGMGAAAPALAHAKRALTAADVPHIRWHLEPADVDRARAAVAAYVPPPQPAGGAKRRPPPAAAKPLPSAALVLRWHGANPKRPGSGAHRRWEVLRGAGGKTVGQYLSMDGSNADTLRNAIAGGYVKLEEK